MFKILKNLKQSWLSVLTIVTLLCVQAAVDLELPNYTSKIVNTGIQAGGIEYAVPETISQKDMDAILLFSNDDDKILENYTTEDTDGNYVIKDLKESLDNIINLQPEHISVYSLIVEDGTPIAKKIDNGQLILPTDDMERNMYWYVKNTLELRGYKHYEISNFAKRGYESRHNMNCWNQSHYFGFGAAAHSYRDITRYSNTPNIEEYIKNIKMGDIAKNRIIHEIQKESDREKEYMLLGLRKIKGVKINDFKAKFVKNPIYVFRNELKKLSDENLIAVDANSIRLTPRGIDLANLVWEEFI